MRRRGTGDYFKAANYDWQFYPQPYRFIAQTAGPGGMTPDYASAASMGLTTRALGGFGAQASSIGVPTLPVSLSNPYGPHPPNIPQAVWDCVAKSFPPKPCIQTSNGSFACQAQTIPPYVIAQCQAGQYVSQLMPTQAKKVGVSGLGCGGGGCKCGGTCGMGQVDFSFLTNPVSVFGYSFPLWIGLAAGIGAIALMKGTHR